MLLNLGAIVTLNHSYSGLLKKCKISKRTVPDDFHKVYHLIYCNYYSTVFNYTKTNLIAKLEQDDSISEALLAIQFVAEKLGKEVYTTDKYYNNYCINNL